MKLEKVSILIADDLPENLIALKAVLEAEDFEIVTATSGKEVLSVLSKPTSFALLLLDVMMPEMDGYDTAAQVRKIIPSLPIIFVTAIDQDEVSQRRGYQLGAVDYLFKPIDLTILRTKVSVFVELHRNKMMVEQQSRLLAESDRRERDSFLGNILDAVVGVDEAGNITDWNARAEATFGWKKADVLGRDMGKVIMPIRYREWHHHGMAHFLKTGEGPILNSPVEVPALRNDGSEFPIELTVTAVRLSQGFKFYSFIRDITERKEAEDARKRNEANLILMAKVGLLFATSLDAETILKKIAELVVPTFGDWCSVVLKPIGTELPKLVAVTHVDPTKIKFAKELIEKYPTDWNAKHGAGNVIRTGEAELYTELPDELLALMAKDDEHLELLRKLEIISCLVVPLKARRGIIGAITVASSESNRKYCDADLQFLEDLAYRAAIAMENAILYGELQTNLIEVKEAVKARDEFLSIASHELKTPITSLKLQLQMTQRGLDVEHNIAPTPEKLEKVFESANRQIRRLEVLMEDLLDVTKIRAGKLTLRFEKVELMLLVKEILDRFEEQIKDAECEVLLNLKSVSGSWDRSRVEQVVANLISNAIKYAARSKVEVSTSTEGRFARISVKDHGPGIPKEKQEVIFERFERATSSRSISGLGLGLFIVKQIVIAHDGSIHVNSDLGKGTEFVVDLPI